MFESAIMWKQLGFLLVAVAIVHARPSSKDKFEHLVQALEDLIRDDIKDEIEASPPPRKEEEEGPDARHFYLVKANEHPESAGDSPLKDDKPSWANQEPDKQSKSTGRPQKPDGTGQPPKDEQFYEYLRSEELNERKQKERPKSDGKKPKPSRDGDKPQGTGKPPKPDGTGQSPQSDRPKPQGTGKPPMDDQEPPKREFIKRLYEYLRREETEIKEKNQKERKRKNLI